MAALDPLPGQRIASGAGHAAFQEQSWEGSALCQLRRGAGAAGASLMQGQRGANMLALGSLCLPLAIPTAKWDKARKLWHRLSRVTRALWLDSVASPQAKSQGAFSWKRAFSGAYLASRRWAVSARSALRRAGSLLSCRSHHFTHAASLEPEASRRSR